MWLWIYIPFTNRQVYLNFASYHAPQTSIQFKEPTLFSLSVYTMITSIISINKQGYLIRCCREVQYGRVNELNGKDRADIKNTTQQLCAPGMNADLLGTRFNARKSKL